MRKQRRDRAGLGVVVGLGLWVLPGPAPAAGGPPAASRITLSDREAARSVEAALHGAQRRLARPFCQELLTDFADAAGRPLRHNLQALGETPEGYLGLLRFVDGATAASCHTGRATAVTMPGSRVVWVCSRRFAAHAQQDRRAAEVVLIHEMLHTLGLGENPPTGGEINLRVAWRCGGGQPPSRP